MSLLTLNARRVLALAALVAAAGCSKKDDPLGGEGDACVVDADCEANLACRGDVCVPRATDDMGPEPDGSTPNDQPNNTPVQDEDYFVSYVLRDSGSVDTLWVYDTATDRHTKITPEGENCQLGCWLSEDMQWYVTAAANGAAFDVEATRLTGAFAPDGAPTSVATAVRRVEVIGNTLTYVREDNGESKAYYRPLDGGGEVLIGTIGSATSTEGDWHIDPATGLGVVYNATLQTMDVKIGELGTELAELTFTLDSSNYQETSGSYFGGSIPTAFSRDGKTMALVTQKAPNDYNLCENASECTGVGQRCGRFGRCSAIEVAVHFFDLDNLDRLGQPCSADDACGPKHVCDIPAETAVDQAVCIPRRTVLGLPAQQMQNGSTGCALTEGNDDYFYSEIRGPISFGADGSLYLTAARDCGDLAMQHTAILRMSPTEGTYEVVFGNEGRDFSADACYDPVEERIDVTDCAVWVDKAIVSPGSNELAFVATNPNVLEPQLAQSNIDLWTVKRDGTDHSWVGQHPELDVVRSFAVHPPR